MDALPLFTVKFYKLSGLVPPQCQTASAAAARRIAKDALASGAAKRAEILDPSGIVLREFPDPHWDD